MKFNLIDKQTKCDRCGFTFNYVLTIIETDENICPGCLTSTERVELSYEIK